MFLAICIYRTIFAYRRKRYFDILGTGINNPAESTEYFKPYIIYNIDKIASGDSFHDIGPGATIINKSLVQGSFNKVEREYGGDVKQALDQISQFIEKYGNPAAGALFNTFNQELSKPRHEKSTIKGICDGIEKVLPSISTELQEEAVWTTFIAIS